MFEFISNKKIKKQIINIIYKFTSVIKRIIYNCFYINIPDLYTDSYNTEMVIIGKNSGKGILLDINFNAEFRNKLYVLNKQIKNNQTSYGLKSYIYRIAKISIKSKSLLSITPYTYLCYEKIF